MASTTFDWVWLCKIRCDRGGGSANAYIGASGLYQGGATLKVITIRGVQQNTMIYTSMASIFTGREFSNSIPDLALIFHYYIHTEPLENR